MTVQELIRELMRLENGHAAVYVWDGDNSCFVPVDEISAPGKGPPINAPELKPGAVVIWGS